MLGAWNVIVFAAALAVAPGATQPEPDEPSTEDEEVEPAPKETEPAPKKSEPAPKKSEPAPKETEPAPKKSEPAPKKSEASPDEPAPDEPSPDEPAPDEPSPDEPAPDEPAPEEAEPTPPPEPVAPPISSPDARRRAPGGLPPTGRDTDIVRRVLLGGGIASLTIGAGLAAPSIYFASESVKADKAANQLETSSEADERAAAEKRRDAMRTNAIAIGAVAGAYVITGVVLLALLGRDRKPPRQTVSPTAGVNHFGLMWRGRF